MFIIIDGADGTGKTSQAKLTANWLTARTGNETILVREPGGTEPGEEIRKIILSNSSLTDLTRLFLFNAARTEIMDKVILPALRSGKNVVMDRGFPSTLVYQGKKVPQELLHLSVWWATYSEDRALFKPHIIILDASQEVRAGRLSQRGAGNWLDKQTEDVAADYRVHAEALHWALIDANGSIDTTQRLIRAEISRAYWGIYEQHNVAA